MSEGGFGNQEPEPTFGTRSHPKLEGVHQDIEYPGKKVLYSFLKSIGLQNNPDNGNDGNFYESTGRFGGHFIPYGYEFNDEGDSNNIATEERSLNNEKPYYERKSSGTSSKRVKD